MTILLAPLLALGGWIVPWQRDAGITALESARGRYEDVFLFAARLDADGRPTLEGSAAAWSAAVERIHAGGARAWLTVVNDRVGTDTSVLKDADVVHRMLADPDARAAHSAGIVALARGLAVDGVDLDYENLPASEREAFTAFVKTLSADLRKAGFSVSVTVQPKRGESSATGPGAADWPRICEQADRLQVMLYNQHNASSGPGPVASPDWIAGIVDYALRACPAAKVVPVLKVSGMDWGPGKTEWRSFQEVSTTRAAQKPKVKRERGSQIPWFTYRAPDGRHTVYYEDARSLETKARALRSRGLATVMLWSLGSEDPETAERLSQNR